MSRCLGCGIELQNEFPLKDGYVDDLEHKYCLRCFSIMNYGVNKKTERNNLNYFNILDKIKDNDTVIYISSLLTCNLDYIDKFKNVVLVLTKRDIIPKSVKDYKIENYFKNKYKNIKDVLIVSSFKKYNLDILYNYLCKIKGNIYFVGVTNSGKSSLINSLRESYGILDNKITTSNFPSTTLDSIKIKLNDLTIIDTPGIVLENSIINYLKDKDLKKINVKKEIKPLTYQIKGNGSFIIDNFFRIDYFTDTTSMTFYMANNLRIKHVSQKNISMNEYKNEDINIKKNQDLVIEDIGFIKVTNSCKIKIYYKDNIYYYLRDNLI